MSELTDVIDGLTAELERYRELHAETLIAHSEMCNRLSESVMGLRAELLEARALLRQAQHFASEDFAEDPAELDESCASGPYLAFYKQLLAYLATLPKEQTK